MPRYLMTYLGGDHPEDPEQGRQHFARYTAWLTALGEAALSPMNPLQETHTVEADGAVRAGGDSGMSGYTIVEAESLDAALEMARSCPFLDIGGRLEVSRLVDMQAAQ